MKGGVYRMLTMIQADPHRGHFSKKAKAAERQSRI